MTGIEGNDSRGFQTEEEPIIMEPGTLGLSEIPVNKDSGRDFLQVENSTSDSCPEVLQGQLNPMIPATPPGPSMSSDERQSPSSSQITPPPDLNPIHPMSQFGGKKYNSKYRNVMEAQILKLILKV